MPAIHPTFRSKTRAVMLAANTNQLRDPIGEMDSMAFYIACHRGQEVCRQAIADEHWYRVVSGMVRKSTLLIDGRRRIVDFFLPGDFFGFSTRDERAFNVEAVIEGTVVTRYPRRQMEALAEAHPEVGRLIRQMAFESISRLQARILILGHPTALTKVCAFLVEMANRSSGPQTLIVALPMSRYDIADYLALSVETVSRALTELKHRGTIDLTNKHRVLIMSRTKLEGDLGNARSLAPRQCV